jgi:protein-tyrosine phosphatase
MIPLVDIHCHLLAGLDDGPRTTADAVAMCRIAYDDGIQMSAATAHQNPRWADNDPDRIRTATRELGEALRAAGVPLTVFPCAEVMAEPDTPAAWEAGRLLSLGDRGQYLLLEMPRGQFVELGPTLARLRRSGVRVVLAHPELCPELLEDAGRIEGLIEDGCLVQVSSGSVAEPRSARDESALRDWFRRGVVHLMGSDGHSARRRPPLMAAAYGQVLRWAGRAVADRVCSANGMAVLQGLPLRVAAPRPRARRWLPCWW